MKKIYTFFIIFLLFSFQTVSAQSGTCGTNVAYTISGDTITFSKSTSSATPVYDLTCTDVFRDDSSITKVKIVSAINLTAYAHSMFSNFKYVTEMDLSKLNTSNVINMSYMFYSCESLAILNISGWNTSNVTDMSFMFSRCSSLTSLDVSGWDTSKVTGMGSMFSDCSSLTSLDVSGWDTSNVTDMSFMFPDCFSLTSLDVSGWNTSNVTDMELMFLRCSSLTSLDVNGWNTSNVTNMEWLFSDCSSLTSLDVNGWNTSNVTDMDRMFSSCSKLISLDVSGWNTSKVTGMGSMFSNCSSLTSLDLSGWDTSNVTDMSYMFAGCESLTSLDVSGWNTSNVTDMDRMFSSCSKLISLDVSRWNTSNVKEMNYLFMGCNSLIDLNVNKWNTKNTTDMTGLFWGCSSLKTLDLNGWNTANVTNMRMMFFGCSSMNDLNVSDWNTVKVKNMADMFRNCRSLTNLDVSNWNTSNVTKIVNGEIFAECNSLNTITLGEKSAVTNIFDTLPNYNDKWYYARSGPDATSPLAQGTAKTGDALFEFYDYNTMAGTWSTVNQFIPEDKTISLITDDKLTIDYFYNVYGTPIGVDGDKKYTGINYYLSISADESVNGEALIQLPDGFSFNFNHLINTKTVEIVNGCCDSVPVYPIYLSSNDDLEFIITGTINTKKTYTVNSYEDEGVVYYSNMCEKITLDPLEDLLNTPITTYNYNLSKMGAALSSSVYDKTDVIQSLYNLGYLNPNTYGSYGSDRNGISIAVGVRNFIQKNNIKHQIAIVLRGTAGTEWIGNFNVYGILSPNNNQYHNDFYSCAVDVNNWVLGYLNSLNLSENNTKYFVTGHSRGGAVADIYTDEFLGKNATAYTYAAPNSTILPLAPQNIFNIINVNDLVPYLPAGEPPGGGVWGKIGKNIVFGDLDSPNRDSGNDGLIYVLLSLGDSGNEFASFMFNDILIGGALWFNNDVLSPVICSVLGCSNEPGAIDRNHSSVTYLNNIPASDAGKYSMDEAIAIRKGWVTGYFQRTGIKVKNEMKAFWSIVGEKVKSGIESSLIILSIACPVDVDVVNYNNEIIASFRNHELVYIDDSIATGFSEEDEDFLVMSGNQEYRVVINSIDDGTMDVQLVKLDNDLNLVSSQFYDDYSIERDETYTLTYTPASVIEEIPIVNESTEEMTLTISTGKARPGEEVTVGVSIENNPGLAHINLGISYDETKLSYVGHADSGLTGWFPGNLKISWDSDGNVAYNGEILKLKFKVLEGIEEGDAAVSVSCNTGDILAYDETVYTPAIQAGKVTIYKTIPGDITGDGVVDGRDLLRLKRHLVGLNVEIVGNADTTGDGVIDGRDLLRLKRHLVGISVELH